MITQASKPTEEIRPRIVFGEPRSIPFISLLRLKVERIAPILIEAGPLLLVGVYLLICLAAIAAGVYLTLTSNSHAIAVLAALACAGVIYALLSPCST